MTYCAWLIFIGAAILEVAGDAVVRKGLRGSDLIIILIGLVMLGCYGLVVNTLKWDFSKLLGVYVSVFALVSQLFGRFVFKEDIPVATWIGLIVIIRVAASSFNLGIRYEELVSKLIDHFESFPLACTGGTTDKRKPVQCLKIFTHGP